MLITRICHFCKKEVAYDRNDTYKKQERIFIGFSESAAIPDAYLYFHMTCFETVAGEEYLNELKHIMEKYKEASTPKPMKVQF